MKRKFSVSLLVTILIIASLLAGCTGEEVTPTASTPTATVANNRTYSAENPLVIRTSSAFTSASLPIQDGVVKFTDEVTEKTGGAIKFQWFVGGALSKPGEELDQLKAGFVDLALSSSTWYGVLPLWEMTGFLCFQPAKSGDAVRIKWQMFHEFPELTNELSAWNITPLLFSSLTSFQMQSVTPIRTVEDMKGKKVGVLGRGQQMWFNPIGATAMTVTGPDRYDALSKKAIEVTCINPNVQQGEVAPYIVHTDFGCHVTLHFSMNNDTWNKIVPEDQELIQTIAERHMFEDIPEFNDVQVLLDEQTIVTKFNGEVINFPQEERLKWAQQLPNLAQVWIDEAKTPADHNLRIELYKRFLELAAQAGHQWPVDWSQVK